MKTLFLFLHVFAVIMTFGPVAVASSMFPRLVRDGADTSAAIMARITKYYGFAAVLVPLLGLAIPMVQGKSIFEPGLIGFMMEAITLTVVALAILLFWVVPTQAAALSLPLQERKSVFGKLHMSSGIFNLVWFLVLIRMFWH